MSAIGRKAATSENPAQQLGKFVQLPLFGGKLAGANQRPPLSRRTEIDWPLLSKDKSFFWTNVDLMAIGSPGCIPTPAAGQFSIRCPITSAARVFWHI